MNEKTKIMNKEIHAIASHRALLISKRFLSFCLLITALYLGIRRFPVSPLYILLFLNALPIIFTFAAKDYNKKGQNNFLQNLVREDSFILGTLKSKYNYTKLNYVTNSISYLTAIALIGLWQYNYNMQYYISSNLKSIPVLILASGLTVRLVGIVFYQLKLRYDLSHNNIR
jgi:hypothetical protein